MRILLSGPECTGKSFLSQCLKTEYGFEHIPEKAVEYLQALQRPYNFSDLEKIARLHNELYVQYADGSVPVVFDTFLLNIKIWSEYRFGKCAEFIDETIQHIRFDKIFLLEPDLPWEAGPFRENPKDRDILFESYKLLMNQLNWPFEIVGGALEERKSVVLDWVSTQLN